jgi:hypothetical protein
MKAPVRPTTREPARDVAAQLDAVADKKHPKDAAFVARGTPLPAKRPGVTLTRPEGSLVTTNAAKAKSFAKGTTDAGVGKLLGIPSKDSALKAPKKALVVQALDKHGNVVSEAVTSPQTHKQAEKVIGKHVTTAGRLHVTSPLRAQVRRAKG